ncbi:MAG: 5'-nucleotidase [Candidatus Azambacteria bacterium]|nr:5'-nucleotidase [Candidatus Azambacteria bacterium]
MRKSTKKEIQNSNNLVLDTLEKIKELLQQEKKVHIIWDFDGVLADNRSEEVFTVINFNLKEYFKYEERLLSECPRRGPWLLGIAHNAPVRPNFPQEFFSQDIVTARSSTLAMRVYIFCLAWQLKVRWMLFIGHQSKKESYRIILKSLQKDPDYYVFCVDDKAKHVEDFRLVSVEEGMENRAIGIVSPVVRTYNAKELKKHFNMVMKATGNVPIRVRDPSNDLLGFIVLPKGVNQFREQINTIIGNNTDRGYYFELRNTFVKVNGEVGKGRFKTEKELKRAMQEFIVGLCCP